RYLRPSHASPASQSCSIASASFCFSHASTLSPPLAMANDAHCAHDRAQTLFLNTNPLINMAWPNTNPTQTYKLDSPLASGRPDPADRPRHRARDDRPGTKAGQRHERQFDVPLDLDGDHAWLDLDRPAGVATRAHPRCEHVGGDRVRRAAH